MLCKRQLRKIMTIKIYSCSNLLSIQNLLLRVAELPPTNTLNSPFLSHLALAVKKFDCCFINFKRYFLVSPGLSSTISKPLAL
jgi:hypothetical protein